MSEYIDRESVQDAIAYAFAAAPEGEAEKVCFDINARIKSIPAADVRPVKRGKWEDVDVAFIDSQNTVGLHAIASMLCPVCERYHNEAYWYGEPTDGVNFCPNCGADMRNLQSDSTNANNSEVIVNTEMEGTE